MVNYPNDWEEVNLANLNIKIMRGDTITKNEVTRGPFPVIAGGKKPAYFHNKYNRDGKTITISASGANAGYVHLYAGKIFASDCLTISELDNDINIEFLYHMLKHKQDDIYSAQTGGAQPHIYPKNVQGICISYTKDKVEQKNISDTLSTFDDHIDNLERLIEKKKMIRDGALEELMTGNKRLEGFNGEWEEVSLGEIGTIKMCRRVFQYETSNSGDIPFYKIGTFGGKPDSFITRDKYMSFKSKYPFPKKGDVLLSAAGSIGKAIIYDGEEAYFQDSNIVWLEVDKKRISNIFLYFFYKKFPWRNMEGTTISRLYNKLILNTKIGLPTLKEQQAIVDILTAMDEEIENLEKEKEKIEKIKKGAMEDLLTGKIRLD